MTRKLFVLSVTLLPALTACSLPESGLAAPPNFNPGPTPQSSVIFCDIEKMGTGFDNTSRVCVNQVSPSFSQDAIAMTGAALAVNTGQGSRFAIDTSAGAVNRCGSLGEIVEFLGPFPQGTPTCLNCGSQIPATFTDANAACRVLCEDLSVPPPNNPPSSAVATFCASHAHVSTNVPAAGCPSGFAGACTDAGTLRPDFVDPRIFPEPVVWTDLRGVTPGGLSNNDLTQTGVGNGQYIAGAASAQWVPGGDAFVEFSAAETNLPHVVGFSAVPASCPFPCHDLDGSMADVSYGINLDADGRLYIVQGGAIVPGLDLNGSWGTYAAGDRFRVTVVDRGNGFFDIRYSRVIGTCTPGLPCNDQELFVNQSEGAYPVRVDASFRDQNATVRDVRLLRIIPPQ